MHIRSPRDLGLVIRETRRSQKLTQAQLAARAGVTREWVVALERGNPGAEVGRVFKVLSALRLEMEVPTGSAVTHSNANVPSRIDTIIVRAARHTP